MPITTSLPAPDIAWIQKLSGPIALQNPSSKFGTAGPRLISADGLSQWSQAQGGPMTRNAGVALNRYNSYQGVGAASSNIWDGVRGRGSMAMNSAGNNSPTGGAICPPEWCPQLTAVTGQNPGSKQDAGALVAVYDVSLWWDIPGLSPMMNDQAGIWFLPYNVLADARAVPAANLIFNTCFGGFGVFLNNVGGVGTYEYVSWRTMNPPAAAGIILERVPVPPAVAPTLQAWNTIRFVIVSATNNDPATLSVQVNEQDVVPVRTFGSAVLDTPETSMANAATPRGPGMVCGFNTAGTAFVWGHYHIKLGRFTPGGAAVETF